MGSPETHRPQQNQPEEIIHSGALGSQFNKYVGKSETKIPVGKEWALILLRMIPDAHKGRVTAFIMSVPHENRQVAAENLAEHIEAKGDQIWRSRYPEVELDQCMEQTRVWLEAREGKKELAN
jgi:hypothetical protein